MKAVLILLFSFFASVITQAHPGVGGHLAFAGGALHAHLSWDQGPDNHGNESVLRLEWHDGATHARIEPGVSFEVSLWMPSMGHGSAPTQIQRILDPQGQIVTGAYQVRNMYFVMPGDWDVRVTLERQDGTKETQTWSVSVEGNPNGGHGH